MKTNGDFEEGDVFRCPKNGLSPLGIIMQIDDLLVIFKEDSLGKFTISRHGSQEIRSDYVRSQESLDYHIVLGYLEYRGT